MQCCIYIYTHNRINSIQHGCTITWSGCCDIVDRLSAWCCHSAAPQHWESSRRSSGSGRSSYSSAKQGSSMSTQFAMLRTSRIEQHYKPLTRTPTTSYLFLEERKLWRAGKAPIIHVEACRQSLDRHSVPPKKHRLLRMTTKTWVWRMLFWF